MKEKIKSLLYPDFKSALDNARADERAICNADKNKALAEQENKLNNFWSLKVKELESKIESMEFRLQNHDAEKQAVENEKQDIREVAIRQRRIISDLVFIARQKIEDDAKRLQDFEKLKTDVKNVEAKMIGMEKK